jgi:phosphatidylglycerophosphatase A
MSILKSLATLLASGGYVGFLGARLGGISGTLGSLSYLILWLLTPNSWQLPLALIIICGGFLVTHFALFNTSLKDPGWIVIDEWAGLAVALLFSSPTNIMSYALPFIVFRLFDITKPGIIRQVEKLPGALGVMSDDLLAGLVGLISYVLFPLVVFAQVLPPPSLPESDFAEFTINSNLKLGGRIYFTARIDGKDSIMVLDLDNNWVKRSVEGPGDNRFPTVSPSGIDFAFISNRDGNEDLYLSDWDGAKVTRLTKGKTAAGDPFWSQNSDRIIYYRTVTPNSEHKDQNATAFYTLKVDRLNVATTIPTEELITSLSGKNLTPAFEPSGNKFAFSTNRFWPGWDICTLDIKPQAKEFCILAGTLSFGRPKYSPDGKEIVFSFGDARDMNLGLYSVGTRKFKKLTIEPMKEYDAEWSKDGKFLVYAGNSKGPEQYELFIFDIEKNRSFPLLSHPTYSLRYPSWSEVRTVDLELVRLRDAERNLTPGDPISPTPIITSTPLP